MRVKAEEAGTIGMPPPRPSPEISMRHDWLGRTCLLVSPCRGPVPFGEGR